MKLIVPILFLFLGGCNLLSDPSTSTITDTDAGPDALDVLGVTCSDSLKNGNETDLNCGGECRPCTDNLSCLVNKDCTSGICTEEICSPPQCNDGVKNGTESDLDCGGNCDPCGAGSKCVVLRDCLSQICEALTCKEDCSSKCGGECPQKCEKGEMCETTADCDGDLRCDTVCIVPPDGWKRTISFTALSDSVDFNAYVRFPDLEVGEIERLVFEQNGQPLPSELAEEANAFWVYIKNVTSGENTFSAKMEESKLRDELPMWTDHIAVFHTPGLSPINSEDITVSEAVNVTRTAGPFGSASYFDGSAYVLATGTGIDELFPAFSISVWVNSDINSNDWKPIVGRQFATTNSDDFILGDFRMGKLYACSTGGCAISVDPVPPSVWTFVTMTYDGTMKLYINGEPDAEVTGERSQSLARNPLLIGGDIDGAGGMVDQFFQGSIDELRLSSKVQSASAVRLQFLSTEATFFSFGVKQPL